MNKVKRLECISIIFLALFLFVFLPQAQSADATVTIPVAANAVTGTVDADSPYKLTVKMCALFLRRGDNKGSTYVESGVGDGDTYARVDSDDLNLGWAPGMDASIMLQNQSFGVEARYLGLTEWSESKSNKDYDLYWGEEVNANAKFKSALNNVELNLHWWPCANGRYSLLLGFRWLRLNDRASGFKDVRVYSSGEYWKGSLSCCNVVEGGQLGIEGLLFGKRDQGFSLDGGVKAGVFANTIHNEDSEKAAWNLPQFNEWGGYNDHDRWERRKAVWLGELGVNLNYAFTKNIAMTVGYELLYISKVAVPVNNFGSTQHVLYQGSRVGLIFSF